MSLEPLLKWAGGKESELPVIQPLLPYKITRYFEPFIGGGAVYFNTRAAQYFINDRSDELVGLYQSIKSRSAAFYAAIEAIDAAWQKLGVTCQQQTDFLTGLFHTAPHDDASRNTWFLQQLDQVASRFLDVTDLPFAGWDRVFQKEILRMLPRKMNRMYELAESKGSLSPADVHDNLEGAVRAAFYMTMRTIYNHPEKYGAPPAMQTAVFLYIRNYAFSGMFRYNDNGEFNVPYGGIGYNRKTLKKKLAYYQGKPLNDKLGATTIGNEDFEVFLRRHQPGKSDFVFLDPPYDSEFSSYAGNTFGREDQLRLANYLIDECAAPWMVVIKETDFIRGIYTRPGVFIESYDKTYMVSFKDRNDREVNHLIITNYPQNDTLQLAA